MRSTLSSIMSAALSPSPPPSSSGCGGGSHGGILRRHKPTTVLIRTVARSRSGTAKTTPPTPAPSAGPPCADQEPPVMEPSFVKCVPPGGDERERDVCTTCGFIDYRNPKVVVGCLPIWVGLGRGRCRCRPLAGVIPLPLSFITIYTYRHLWNPPPCARFRALFFFFVVSSSSPVPISLYLSKWRVTSRHVTSRRVATWR